MGGTLFLDPLEWTSIPAERHFFAVFPSNAKKGVDFCFDRFLWEGPGMNFYFGMEQTRGEGYILLGLGQKGR